MALKRYVTLGILVSLLSLVLIVLGAIQSSAFLFDELALLHSILIIIAFFLLLLSGIYYIVYGLYQERRTKLLTSSAVMQTIALALIVVGVIFTLIVCSINSGDGFCVLVSAPFIGLAAIAAVVGIILLGIHFIVRN